MAHDSVLGPRRIITNQPSQDQQSPMGRVERGKQLPRPFVRSNYPKDAAQNWGSRQEVSRPVGNTPRTARVCDVVLPEPQDVTVYLRGPAETGLFNRGLQWRITYGIGGIDLILNYTAPALGRVVGLRAQTVRVEALHNSFSTVGTFVVEGAVALGRPQDFEQVLNTGTVTNDPVPTSTRLRFPLFGTYFRVSNDDPNFNATNVQVEQLDAGLGVVEAAPLSYYQDNFVPVAETGVFVQVRWIGAVPPPTVVVGETQVVVRARI